MTDVEIDFLDGQGWQELTDRERMLMDKAREAGYDRGYAVGKQHGYEEATHDWTTLTTAVSQRPALKATERLLHFLLGEDEQASPLWRSGRR